MPRALLAEADTQQSSGKHRTARGAGATEGTLWPLGRGGTKPHVHAAGSQAQGQKGTRALPGEGVCGVVWGRPELGAGGQAPSLGGPSSSPGPPVPANIPSLPGLWHCGALGQAEFSHFRPGRASTAPGLPVASVSHTDTGLNPERRLTRQHGLHPPRGCLRTRRLLSPAPERGEGRGGLGGPLPAMLPYTPPCCPTPRRRAGTEAGMRRAVRGIHTFGSSGHSVGYGEGRRGGGGETEKQKNRFVSRGSEARGSQAGHPTGWQGSSGDARRPLQPPAPTACPCGFQEKRPWPAWASSKPKPCSPPRSRTETPASRQGSLARGLRAGLGFRWQGHKGRLTGPGRAAAGERVAVPRREATLARLPCPGQAGTDTHCR